MFSFVIVFVVFLIYPATTTALYPGPRREVREMKPGNNSKLLLPHLGRGAFLSPTVYLYCYSLLSSTYPFLLLGDASSPLRFRLCTFWLIDCGNPRNSCILATVCHHYAVCTHVLPTVAINSPIRCNSISSPTCCGGGHMWSVVVR